MALKAAQKNIKKRALKLFSWLLKILDLQIEEKKLKIKPKMFVMEYWKQFKPVPEIIHTLTAITYTCIALFAFVTNVMVIYYLTR